MCATCLGSFVGGQLARDRFILVLRECIWNPPAYSLVLPAFGDTGSLGSLRQAVYPLGYMVPPWVTASHVLAGNREAELKLTVECCLLGLLLNNNNNKYLYIHVPRTLQIPDLLERMHSLGNLRIIDDSRAASDLDEGPCFVHAVFVGGSAQIFACIYIYIYYTRLDI